MRTMTIDTVEDGEGGLMTFLTQNGWYDAEVEDPYGYCWCCGELRHESCCSIDTDDDDCEC